MELTAENYNISTNENANDMISQEDFRIKLIFSEDNDRLAFNPYFMVQTANAAFSCHTYFGGLEHKIIDFSITCNKEILNTNANEPIDYSKFNVYSFDTLDNTSNEKFTVQEWLNIMNRNEYLSVFEWYFEFNTPINSDENLKFKIYLKQEDGTEFEVETSAIQIS